MRPVRIVPHTHWDREWYLSFEEFRQRLVRAMESVLQLVSTPGSHFHLDGQTAMIDDFLAVCPEREDELAAGIASGRLSCGPWVTLMDEFLVSGESIVRNLEDGMRRAAELGGAGPVAYLPDQFGHVSQMPQILRTAGFTRVVVWRGVPSEVTGSGFTWTSPDGSEIGAFYLPFGYGQGARMPTDLSSFAARVAEEVDRMQPFLRAGEPMLLMAGDDHEIPDPDLPALLQRLRSRGEDVAITSLAEHLSSWSPPARRVTGELRSAARANLLPSTYSVRPHQKSERARAEHLLERYAEPLAALVAPESWPEERFAGAWGLLHLNGAHDSVCGCSTDEVARAVDARITTVAETASAIARGALSVLAGSVKEGGTLAFNPSPFERDGVPGLGWSLIDEAELEEFSVPIDERDGWAVARHRDGEVALRVEDQADDGDLYTFDAAGDPVAPRSVVVVDDGVTFRFEHFDVSLRATGGQTGFIRFTAEVENRGPDHRIRVHLSLPSQAAGTVAGSPFDIVRRPVRGEGGDSEPGATLWPARGFVTAGSSGLLSEGVVEYELLGGELALTLVRCTGTISRPGPLASRKTPAGPDVPTPDAQMLGRRRFSFGVLIGDPGRSIVEAWERYALPLMTATASGGGKKPSQGCLLDISAPALSSVRLLEGSPRVRVFNPFDTAEAFSVGERTGMLGPHEIGVI